MYTEGLQIAPTAVPLLTNRALAEIKLHRSECALQSPGIFDE